MYVYAKYCPVAATTSILGDFWTPLILRELLYGTTHFNQLARNVPGISRTLLAGRLRALERAGVLERQGVPGSRTVDYLLTESGRGLQPVIDAMNDWGLRWASPEPDPTELDPVIMICMLKSRMRSAELPPERVVIEVTVTGGQAGRAWLVCEDGSVGMCFDHPGFEMDLWVSGEILVLYSLWLNHISMADALSRGLVTVDGPPRLTQQFARWFDGATEACIPIAVGEAGRFATTPTRPGNGS